MQHVTVYGQPGKFAGWPANHGHWQWGNEFLVGFLRGGYLPPDQDNGAGHRIKRPYEKLLARSIDGGLTWAVETPNVDFLGTNPAEPPSFNLLDPNTIIRVCGTYDTGGEDCHVHGAFYLSEDKGHTWRGPYRFDPLEPDPSEHNTSRTCVLGYRLFLSYAKRNRWGSDYIVEVAHDGFTFKPMDIVIKDTHRAVMPAVAYMPGRHRTVLVCRRKGHGENWIDVFGSDSGGSWNQLTASPIADTGWHNGNPPALAVVGGETLLCAYGDRSRRTIEVIKSEDGGTIWVPHKTLRETTNLDLGYPRLFTREDGHLVCVYYIADNEQEPNRIEACIFDP